MIYTEEERENLWIEKLDKGERWVGGTCVKRKNYKTDKEFENQCLKILEERRREAAKRRSIEVKEFNKNQYRDQLYVPKIMCSAGIGKQWTKGIGAKRARYVPCETLEEYRGVDGAKRGLPIYYRNLIYTDEEREKLWIEKLK